MLKQTLSAITAIVIGMSGLSAEESKDVGININTNNKKDVIVLPNSNRATQPVTSSYVEENSGGVYGDPYSITPAQNMTPAVSTQNYGDTIIYANGVKKHYLKGEPIKVKLKLKRDAYIYFWTVSATGKGYLILPNSFTSYNKFKKATHYVVPEHSATYDFVSDRAGVEQIFILATNKKISSSTLQSIFSQKSGGMIPTASNKDIRKFITKDIYPLAKREQLKYDIEKFQIQVLPTYQPNLQNVNININ